jgi:predicted nucleotidyltransferase
MGFYIVTGNKKGKGLGEVLFSATQRKVLALLFGSPERRYYGKEIISLSASGTGAVQRELEKLVAAGLVLTSKEGKQRYYSANPRSAIFDELRGIVLKTFGVAEPVRAALRPFAKKIRVAFIFGSVAKRDDTAGSDIDLLVVVDGVRYADLRDQLMKAEKIVGRPINPSLYSVEEFSAKIRSESAFVKRVVKQAKIMIAGTTDDLEALVESGEDGQPQS